MVLENHALAFEFRIGNSFPDSGSGRINSGYFSKTDELCHRSAIHFAHHTMAMYLYCIFNNVKLVSNLLVELAGDDKSHNFILTRG